MHRRTWTLAVVALLAYFAGMATLSSPLSRPPAHAETASSSDEMVIVTGNFKSGAAGLVWLIHSPSRRLLVYERRNGQLTLGAARNIDWDLQLREFPKGRQVPAVSQVRKDTQNRPDPPLGSGKIIAVTGKNIGGTRDLLFVYDTKTQRLAIYDYDGKTLTVDAVRMIRFDLKMDEWIKGTQEPSVKAVRDVVQGR